jgi:hypothetical protein
LLGWPREREREREREGERSSIKKTSKVKNLYNTSNVQKSTRKRLFTSKKITMV